MRAALSTTGRVRIFCNPYVRTRQTSEGIEAALQPGETKVDGREAVELRELEFGLFDGIPDDEPGAHFPIEFFAQMPLGESRCQVAERVKGLFGTILRDSLGIPVTITTRNALHPLMKDSIERGAVRVM